MAFMTKHRVSSKIINGFNIVSPREAKLHDLEDKVKLSGFAKSAQEKGLIGWVFSLGAGISFKNALDRAYHDIYQQARERSATVAVITRQAETKINYYLEAELYR